LPHGAPGIGRPSTAPGPGTNGVINRAGGGGGGNSPDGGAGKGVAKGSFLGGPGGGPSGPGIGAADGAEDRSSTGLGAAGMRISSLSVGGTPRAIGCGGPSSGWAGGTVCRTTTRPAAVLGGLAGRALATEAGGWRRGLRKF
jgi:hypothetical protein